MLKKTITYTDWNGNQRSEDFYFNFSKAELAEMELSVDGGLSALLTEIQQSGQPRRIMDAFKEIIGKAYGEKSADGRRFVKSDEISRAFFETPAYDSLFEELLTKADYAAEFVRGLMPADMVQQAQQVQDKPQVPAAFAQQPQVTQTHAYPPAPPVNPYGQPPQS